MIAFTTFKRESTRVAHFRLPSPPGTCHVGSAGQNGGNGRGEVTAPRAPPGGGWGDELSAARAARAQRGGRRPKWVAGAGRRTDTGRAPFRANGLVAPRRTRSRGRPQRRGHEAGSRCRCTELGGAGRQNGQRLPLPLVTRGAAENLTKRDENAGDRRP